MLKLSNAALLLFSLVTSPVFAESDHTASPPRRSNRVLIQETTPALSFPCQDEIDRAKKRPRLVLVGEEHSTLGSQLSMLKRMEDVKSGKCFAALEGFYCEDASRIQYETKKYDVTPGAPVFGFDDEFTLGLVAVLAPFGPGGNFAGAQRTFIGQFENQPFLKEAWSGVSRQRPFASVAEEAIAKVIDLASKESSLAARERVDSLAKDHAWKTDPAAFRSVMKRLAGSYAVMAKSEKYRQRFHVPSNLDAIMDDSLSGKDFEAGVKTLVVEWRNQFMAKNLGQIYCKALKAGKDLYVITGQLHTPGLRVMLQTMSKGLVPVVEEDANDLSDDNQLLDRYLQELSRRLSRERRKVGEVDPLDPLALPIPDRRFRLPPSFLDDSPPIAPVPLSPDEFPK